MNIEELKYLILQQFGFPPTPEQAQALDVFVQFMTDSNPHAVMILRGSAVPVRHRSRVLSSVRSVPFARR